MLIIQSILVHKLHGFLKIVFLKEIYVTAYLGNEVEVWPARIQPPRLVDLFRRPFSTRTILLELVRLALAALYEFIAKTVKYVK